MKQYAFESMNRARWRDFTLQLDQLESHRRVEKPEAQRFALQKFCAEFTHLSRDLALARSRGYSQRLEEELNHLVSRGHNLLYARRTGFLRAALDFLFVGFPQRVRQEWRFVMVATAAFLLPAFAIAYAIGETPELLYSVMQPDEVYSLESMYDPAAKHFGRERQSGSDFSMFGFYIQHNISISFQVFSTGILAGLGSLFYLVFNGVILGAITTHLISLGYGSTFLSFVIGHGSFELTAIVLSGAAGLKLGYSLISPGLLPRTEALKQGAASAVPIVIGAALMLVIAAFLEAFWSSTRFVPAEIKYLVGGVLWCAVFCYFWLAGKYDGA